MILAVMPRAARAADPAVGVALAAVALLFWTRLYSPQFSLWILPFFALLPLSRRALGALLLGDLAVFFTVYPLSSSAGRWATRSRPRSWPR